MLKILQFGSNFESAKTSWTGPVMRLLLGKGARMAAVAREVFVRRVNVEEGVAGRAQLVEFLAAEFSLESGDPASWA